MIDAVISWHTNPLTCGVARFSAELARRLGVPYGGLELARAAQHPLFSVKTSEWVTWWTLGPLTAAYDLWLHDVPTDVPLVGHQTCSQALRAYAASPVIAQWWTETIGTPIETLWCPATPGPDTRWRPERFLTFGMADKIREQAPRYAQFGAWAAAHGLDYQLCLSCSVHDGMPWAESVDRLLAGVPDLGEDRLLFLGTLSDALLRVWLPTVTGVVQFYEPALRANHTSAWLALEHGVPLITNLDADSPPEAQHGVNVLDLAQLAEWPDAAHRRELRAGGARLAARYGWEPLLTQFQAAQCR